MIGQSSRIVLIVAVLVNGAGLAAMGGVMPEGFSLLADRSGVTVDSSMTPRRETVKSPWMPTSDDVKRGFAVAVIDTSDEVNPDWIWPQKVPVATVDGFACRGQYRAAALAIRTLGPVKGLVAAASPLTKAAGSVLSTENISVRRVQYVHQPDKASVLWKGRWLEKAVPEDHPANWTVWIWVTFYIPADTAPGIYRGSIRIQSDTGAVDIPVRLRVLDLTLTYPQGSWGMYVVGHFHSRPYIQGENWAPEGWEPENLTRYFRLWKAYHLNAPTFYHVFPDFKCIDGHAVTDYSDLSRLMASVKAAKLDGETVILLTWLEFWAHAAATKLDQLRKDGKSIKGEVCVFKGGFKGLEYKTWKYSDEAKRIFREELQQMLDLARRENWPEFKLLVEEETGFPSIKTAAYDQFMPILKEMAPDKAYITDNAVGWGNEALERGARDKIPIREYNNWTPEALAAAHRDGAQVRTYNYGFTRGAFGLYQRFLNTTGNRQWADQFVHRTLEKYRWQVIRIRPEGMVTAVDLERVREGMNDQAYYCTLAGLADALHRRGLTEAEKAARAVLKEVVADIPLNNRDFNQWLLVKAPDRELEIRRWKLALAILAAETELGRPMVVPSRVSSARPRVVAAAPVEQQSASDKRLWVSRVTGPVSLDGLAKEACWREARNATGPLWWTWNTEAAMRAKASSLEEFKRMPPPSFAQARFAGDDRGLYILVQCNHSTTKNAKCRFSDDEANIWQDDCMEFFFKTDPQAVSTYHLIVNVAGKRTLLFSNRVIRNPGIRVATVSPINDSGGYAQEIFVPWKSLGLDGAPRKGSVWPAQVGREFHSWRQITCWSQVDNLFSEEDRWGRLVFADGGTNDERVAPAGRAELQVVRCPACAVEGQVFDVEITAPSDMEGAFVAGRFASEGGRAFSLSPVALAPKQGRQRVWISPAGLEAGRWILDLWVSGKRNVRLHVTRELEILPSPVE